MSPPEEGIKFSPTVICLCPVKACPRVCAPVGWDDGWRVAGTPRGLSQAPHTAESTVCEIRMRNVLEPHRLSGYWSKNRLGEAVLPHLSFITLHVKDNQREKQMSESVEQERWRYAAAEVWSPPTPKSKECIKSHTHAGYALHREHFYIALYIFQYPLLPIRTSILRSVRCAYSAHFSAIRAF